MSSKGSNLFRILSFISSIIVLPICLGGQAQDLCKGNLGANIFEDGSFGKGNDPILMSNPDIAPGYRFVTYIPNDGEYTIAKNTSNLNLYSTWLSVGDRTGDDGYIMVVNASYLPGVFYEKEIKSLCPNTLYEFSAEVINLIKRGVGNHILPNIAFLIDGQIKYSTGPVPQNEQWNKVGFSFVTGPDQQSLKLTLRNNAEGGVGNDLALDNISFRACGPKSFIDAETDRTIYKCKDGAPFNILADVGVSDQFLIWQISTDGLNWKEIAKGKTKEINHNQFVPGNYYYRYLTAGNAANIDNEKCRVISDQLLIQVLQDEFNIKDTICSEKTYLFGDTLLTHQGNFDRYFKSSLGCDSLVHLSLVEVKPNNYNLKPIFNDPNCFGENSGTINVFGAFGGYPPYVNQVFNDEMKIVTDLNKLVAGTYKLRSTDKFACVVEETIVLNQPHAFTIATSSDTMIDLGTIVHLDINSSYDDIEVNWKGNELSSNDMRLDYRPNQSGLVIVSAQNERGCEASDSIYFTIDENIKIYYPNILSRHGENSSFGFTSFHDVIEAIDMFEVYDRWGNVICVKKAAEPGNLVDASAFSSPGVYTFIAKIRLLNGQAYVKTGTINFVY